MLVKYTTQQGNLEFSFEVKDIKEAFQRIADIQEIFQQRCIIEQPDGTKVEATELNYVYRQTRDGDFLEIKSVGDDPTNGYRLDIKSTQTGQIFPRKRDRSGVSLPNQGWYRYEPKPVVESDEEKPF